MGQASVLEGTVAFRFGFVRLADARGLLSCGLCLSSARFAGGFLLMRVWLQRCQSAERKLMIARHISVDIGASSLVFQIAPGLCQYFQKLPAETEVPARPVSSITRAAYFIT